MCDVLQAIVYLIPEELFKMELEEGVERVQTVVSTLQSFKRLFHAQRQRVSQYYQPGQEVQPWDFPSSLVFQRTDRVLDRLLKIEVLQLVGYH